MAPFGIAFLRDSCLFSLRFNAPTNYATCPNPTIPSGGPGVSFFDLPKFLRVLPLFPRDPARFLQDWLRAANRGGILSNHLEARVDQY